MNEKEKEYKEVKKRKRALIKYRSDMEDSVRMAAGVALGAGNHLAYAHNMGAFVILVDIERVLNGERVKTMKDFVKEQWKEHEKVIKNAAAKEEEHAENYIH